MAKARSISKARASISISLCRAGNGAAPRSPLAIGKSRFACHRPFTGPDAAGKLAIADLAAGGASIGSIAADLQGNRGKIDLNGVLERVHVPGPQPDLFAAAPIALQAEAILDQPTRPLTFTITHPLIGVTGEAQLGGAMSAIATTSLPNLAPFAALGGAAVEGHGAVVAKIAQQGETMHSRSMARSTYRRRADGDDADRRECDARCRWQHDG